MARTKKVVEETTTKKTTKKAAAPKAAAAKKSTATKKTATRRKGIQESVMETVEDPVVIAPVEEPITDIPKVEVPKKINNSALEQIRKIAADYCGVNVEDYADVDTINNMINEVKGMLGEYFSDESIDRIIGAGVKEGALEAFKIYKSTMRKKMHEERKARRSERKSNKLSEREKRANRLYKNNNKNLPVVREV